MNREELIKELEFCIKLWKERGGCKFGKSTRCNECAAPYLLLKLISGEVIHGDNSKRLSLEDWEDKIKEIKSN